MSYRFVRVTHYYPQYIKDYYTNHPDVLSKSYIEQHQLMIDSSFESASIYCKNLNKIGVEAFDIITNALILQDTWKKEYYKEVMAYIPGVTQECIR